MPCNASYMDADSFEEAASLAYCVRDELDGKTIPKSWREGYHPDAQGRGIRTQRELDEIVALVCKRLQEADVTKLSLEAQLWWRDHQLADQARLEREIADKREATEREAALAKLSPYERKVLGL